jgi:hypothetical protein
MVPAEAIIIGGGLSINEGIALGLKDKLANKFVMTLNYAYKHFPHTCTCFIDKNFYRTTDPNTNPDIYEELKKEPLIIGKEDAQTKKDLLPNTILLKAAGDNAKMNSKTKGFYVGALTGMFGLSVVAYLMQYKGTIFLLGYDWTRRPAPEKPSHNYSGKSDMQTHYYTDIKHRGVGWLSFYENHNADNYFQSFITPGLKIYNVSMISNLTIFEKINYDHMFTLMNNESYNQEQLREEIRITLK